jgi:hypothetical protein
MDFEKRGRIFFICSFPHEGQKFQQTAYLRSAKSSDSEDQSDLVDDVWEMVLHDHLPQLLKEVHRCSTTLWRSLVPDWRNKRQLSRVAND